MTIGTAPDERCNRIDGEGFACDGTMMLSAGENCSCHISPPCGSCANAPVVCDVCGAEGDDE